VLNKNQPTKRMKNLLFAFLALIITAFSSDSPLKDGNYSGTSRAFYTDEPYYGHTNITVENGRIVKVEYFIRDSARHEYFNDQYEKYYAGNDMYIQQCRNDWKGIQSYPDSLLKHQDINKVDVISGATWSYNIFNASVKEALLKAEE
jgi:major membrane immunogen (membrane-anchored lipoprotein)